jgi:hypothetical protein
LFEGNRQICHKVSSAQPTSFLAAKTDEVDSSAGSSAGRKCPRKFHDGNATRRIIICAVEDLIAAQCFIDAEMIQVSAQHDHCGRGFRVGTGQHA